MILMSWIQIVESIVGLVMVALVLAVRRRRRSHVHTLGFVSEHWIATLPLRHRK
jgi:hypothetical protein